MKTFLVAVCIACVVILVAPCAQCFSPAAPIHTRTTTRTLLSSVRSSSSSDHDDSDDDLVLAAATTSTRRGVLTKTLASATAAAASIALPVQARLDPVNKPQLLPSEPGLNVIQTEKFLTTGEAKRMDAKLAKLERDTGYRVRVLCQAYPMTPGLAIRDYWSVGKDDQKDDKYVVLVVDQFQGRGNVLNFNVGDGLRLAFPNSFWTQLQNKYGTTFFVRDNGVDTAVMNAIDDIVQGLYDAARELS